MCNGFVDGLWRSPLLTPSQAHQKQYHGRMTQKAGNAHFLFVCSGARETIQYIRELKQWIISRKSKCTCTQFLSIPVLMLHCTYAIHLLIHLYLQEVLYEVLYQYLSLNHEPRAGSTKQGLGLSVTVYQSIFGLLYSTQSKPGVEVFKNA